MDIKSRITLVLIAGFFGCLYFFGTEVDRSNSNIVKISGVVTNPLGDTVSFLSQDTSFITILDTVTGMFEIEFEIDSTIYLNLKQGSETTRMFVSCGDKIQLSLNTAEFDESIKYTGSEDCSYLAWSYLFGEENEWPNFFDLGDEEIDSVITVYFNPYKEKLALFKESNPDFFRTQSDEINRTVDYIVSTREALAKLPKLGEDPIDFRFQDREGNDVSLSDFVGSVVLVDVWATWCGPCVAEIPFLKQVEEDYRDENIIFLGVSVDTDTLAWEAMMDEKEMHGVHVISGGWSTQFMDDYAINGIPRFMLFDANGKVFDLNAPRPSSDEFRPMIDSLINAAEK